jgi:hypothetical protein
LSIQEKKDESQIIKDLNTRIRQLTKLILTSQTVSLTEDGSASRPGSPVKPAYVLTQAVLGGDGDEEDEEGLGDGLGGGRMSMINVRGESEKEMVGVYLL